METQPLNRLKKLKLGWVGSGLPWPPWPGLVWSVNWLVEEVEQVGWMDGWMGWMVAWLVAWLAVAWLVPRLLGCVVAWLGGLAACLNYFQSNGMLSSQRRHFKIATDSKITSSRYYKDKQSLRVPVCLWFYRISKGKPPFCCDQP